MKRSRLSLVAACVLALAGSRSAEAALFVTITQGASSTSCDTGVVGGCALPGWSITSPDNINFTGTVGGYSIANLNVVSNVPGNAALAGSLDTKNAVQNVSAAGGSLMVDTAAYGFTLPAGPNLMLSSAQAANWQIAAPNDTSFYSASASATNSKTWPGGTLAATPTIINTEATTTDPLVSQSPDVPFVRGVGPFSLIGREIITQAVGSVGSFTSVMIVTPAGVGSAPVPEPASMLLLGTGLIAVARQYARRRPRRP